ncbi:MAG: MarR family transcriptional regulator [Clostridia bacterium]|nr:MarR family transcriptional regulator [Clostridia bacterium]
MKEIKEACSLDVLRMFRSCSHLLHHRKCCPLQGQSRLLVLLLEHDGVTQRELQDLANVRSASLSEALCKLENDGLISRCKCENDRRNIRIRLTESGLEEARRCRRRQHDDAVKLFSVLSDEERRQLLVLLTKLHDSWVETCPQREEPCACEDNDSGF